MNEGQILNILCNIEIGYFQNDFDFYLKKTKAKKKPPIKKKISTERNPPSIKRKNGLEDIYDKLKTFIGVEVPNRYV